MNRATVRAGRFVDRELSWLAFNGRVLQEAADPRVPLYERIRFLAIFSSNLDEFFRVRVAALRTLLNLKASRRKELGLRPRKLLRAIHEVVGRQQEQLGAILSAMIIPELARHDIRLLIGEPPKSLRARLRPWFEQQVRPLLTPHALFGAGEPPFLENRVIHLVVRLRARDAAHFPWPLVKGGRSAYALLEIPAGRLPRFISVAERRGGTTVLMLDDALRLFLPDLFPEARAIRSWSVKLTRDGDLYLGDEFGGDLLQKIREALKRRRHGPPCRLLYDATMPKSLLGRLRRYFELKREDLVEGGRYHNFNDFFAFPRADLAGAEYRPLPQIDVARLDSARSVLDLLEQRDVLISLPYQPYDGVVRMVEEAARDPDVSSMSITIYRTAEDSRIVAGLVAAARNGKAVTVFVEAKARFDEETNLRHASNLEAAGATVIYSLPGLKVHAKLLLIERATADGVRRYGLFSTGNFNEKTARLYVDYVLLSSDARLTDEAAAVFEFLKGQRSAVDSRHLMVAPFNLRERLMELIDDEIRNARGAGRGELILKLNNLEDERLIEKLYEAADAGVRIRLIVRSICALVPPQDGRIDARSIVDRYLEHARVLIAHNNGEPRVWLASADWMGRNLDRRVEVVFPVYDAGVRAALTKMIDIQLSDNSRARLLEADMQNRYRPRSAGDPEIRAQERIYEWLCRVEKGPATLLGEEETGT
jgi:polyphosphate kinase